MLKAHIHPFFRGEDTGDGGIRRVWEAQVKYLPQFGVEIVDSPDEADVLAAHAYAPANWLKNHLDKPLVAMCHGLYWREYEWAEWAQKVNRQVIETIRIANATTSPSDWVTATLRRHTSRYVKTIYHGIDLEDWQPEDNLGYVLWNKTRPDPICDPKPMNLVAAMLPNVQFISTFGDEVSNVKLTGKVTYDMSKELVRRAGVYLATSKETFGIGTLEAMAAGVPVVGFRWGGQTEIVRQNVDGILVRPGDIVALANAISTVLTNRDKYSANARNRASEFSWERAAESYADLFQSLVKPQSKKQSPRTSIIVTNYNLHDYLERCLQSVKDQDDPDWECIVIDDASSDPTGRHIAASFAKGDKRFKVINNKINVYLAEARNIGIRQAKGKYILPLDADDMLASNAVSALATSLDNDRTIHVAYGKVQFVKEDGTPAIFKGFEKTPGYSSWPYQFDITHQLQNMNLLPYSSMFRREAWEQTGGYRPRMRTAEDADFWTRLSSYGFRPKMITDATTLIYRNREGSMSRAQARPEWNLWYPWAKHPETMPAGAVTETQVPIAVLDQTIVSVIIPVGPNHQILVKDAIDSVDAQTFRDWECIVINDSGVPLSELPAWVRIIETGSEKPVGVAAARNLGIRAAVAPLFLCLDADDYLQPNALAIMVDTHFRTRDIIYSDFWEDPHKAGEFSIFKTNDADATRLTRGTLHCVTALTPRSAWEAVGGYDETLPAWEDWDFQLKCADKGLCSRRIAAPLFTYRKHTGSRRDENIANFEVSKRGILAKWGDLWEGRKELMACRACSNKTTIQPPPMIQSMSNGGSRMSTQRINGENVLQVEYIGNNQGTQIFKGRQGNYYQFSAFENVKYVLVSDAAIFQGRTDFTVTEIKAEIEPVSNEPALTAPGAPSQD